ncbi:MAG: hypothetical protein C4567_18605 [Deltaproteobacteria bacterium]|nr:MAG: hypothetical protein C4567_18605 [Deltaproteobacteria bacterium]
MESRPEKGGASRTPGEGAGFLWLAILGFFFLGLILLLRHEMWQDEWQAWLIARESASLPELFRNLRYEGHPGLWHLGLYLVSRVAFDPLGMQLLHLTVATASVYVFLRYSPFTRLQKILFILGYFPFYEYAVISRNYGLGVFALFSFLAVFCRTRPRNYPLLGVILFFLCQTSVYGLMLALVLGVILFWTAIRERTARTWGACAAFALFLLGVGLSVLQLVPPADSGFALDWKFDLDLPHLARTLAAVWKSYVPLPALDYHFWGTNLIPDPRWQALLSVMLLAFGLLLFGRQPLPLFLYGVGTLGILAFTYIKYPGSLRHHGHLYLLFIAGLWLFLDSSFPGTEHESSVGRASAPAGLRSGHRGPLHYFSKLATALSDFCQAHLKLALTALLAVHLAAGVWAASLDLLYPFSEAKEAAALMRRQGLDRLPILGDADDAACSVAGYLGCRIYYAACRGPGSFVVWNRERKTELKAEELLRQARELSRRQQTDVLLLLNYELPPGEFPVIPLQKFTRSLVPVENYHLYLMPMAKP